jgi:hypothetical protein
MRARSIALTIMAACSSSPSPASDAGRADVQIVDVRSGFDAFVPTDVEGMIDGNHFFLDRGYIQFDPIANLLCLSNAPITAPPDCGYSDPTPKTVLYAKFVRNDDGSARWAFPQVEVKQFGPGGIVDMATSGTLTLSAYEPPTRLVGDLTLVFYTGTLQGHVALP